MQKSFFNKILKWSDFFLPQGKKNSFFVKNTKFPITFKKFSDSDFDMLFEDNFHSDHDERFSPLYSHLICNSYYDPFEDDDN